MYMVGNSSGQANTFVRFLETRDVTLIAYNSAVNLAESDGSLYGFALWASGRDHD